MLRRHSVSSASAAASAMTDPKPLLRDEMTGDQMNLKMVVHGSHTSVGIKVVSGICPQL